MNAHWADWIAVGLGVAGAAAWLGWRMRRYLRRIRAAGGKADGCDSPSCAGCPFAKDCEGKKI